MMQPLTQSELRYVPRGEAVYNALRQAVQRGEFEPGERLREVMIAEDLGVSRTPVREAIHRLIAEGLLTNAPSRGVMVTSFDKQQVLELYALREVLEGTAAAAAAHRASDDEITGLWDIVHAEEAHQEDAKALAELNRHFHSAVFAAAHNRYLMAAVNVLADSINLLRGTTFTVPGRPERAHTEHMEIVTAIEQRDAEVAERMARQHIREARRLRLQMLFSPGRLASSPP